MLNISNLQDNKFGMSVVSMPNHMIFQWFNIIFVSSYKATPKTKNHKKTICGVHSSRPYVSRLILSTQFPWNDVPLLFKGSPKILIMSVRRSDKQTPALIVHTISIVKTIA